MKVVLGEDTSCTNSAPAPTDVPARHSSKFPYPYESSFKKE